MDSLRGLIPDDSDVVRKEYGNCHAWEIKTKPMTVWAWRSMCNAIREEFGQHLLNIYNPDERVKMINIEKDERGYITGFSFAKDILEEQHMIGGEFIVYLRKKS